MISDEDVRLRFQNLVLTPVALDRPVSDQIWRGKPAYLWKDAPTGGCVRNKVIFNSFGVIPEYCFDCYKVLIMPRTVMEFFKLLLTFEKMILPDDNTRKCMIEGRDDCAGTYKGFIYCRTCEEGERVETIARETVAREISADVPVLLKRGCSEFARAYPEYAQIGPGAQVMNYREGWKASEDRVDASLVFEQLPAEPKTGPYPPHEIAAMQYWLTFAATIGDASYLRIVGRTVAPLPQRKAGT